VANLIYKKAHLTTEGLNQIRMIRKGMNSCLASSNGTGRIINKEDKFSEQAKPAATSISR